MHPDLLLKLQILRNIMKIPLKINSGMRCAKHNAEVGGKPGSFHLQGKAVDIDMDLNAEHPKIHGIAVLNQKHLFLVTAIQLFNGIGLAHSFTHCDVRDYKACWHY